jgi:hypothetical protein
MLYAFLCNDVVTVQEMITGIYSILLWANASAKRCFGSVAAVQFDLELGVVRILPTATTKMVDKSQINNAHSFMKSSILVVSLRLLHALKSSLVNLHTSERRHSNCCPYWSVSLPDGLIALGSMMTRSEFQKMLE